MMPAMQRECVRPLAIKKFICYIILKYYIMAKDAKTLEKDELFFIFIKTSYHRSITCLCKRGNQRVLWAPGVKPFIER
ncbi:hypothetical protein DWY22_03180 [Heyndrickxia coagulans]|nr:hypothetical protein DWY22_03180 [Heyndrickxia coagulans]RGR99884.1 hypothetical protein DWY16_03700 [Heyndrickxia coagulans]